MLIHVSISLQSLISTLANKSLTYFLCDKYTQFVSYNTSMPRKYDSIPRSFKANVVLNLAIKLFNSAVLGPMINILSTYISTMIRDVAFLSINNDVSELVLTKPYCIRHYLSLSYQAISDCFNLYIDLWNLHKIKFLNINKTFWLMHVNFLRQFSIKKRHC